MLIVFVHAGKAFLPEIDAYVKFFSRGFDCEVITPSAVNKSKADVYWHFMGIARSRKPAVTLHEYTSSSLSPLAATKNLSKKVLNAKPDFRLFLNRYVYDRFQFRDNIPFGYRDMGVSLNWKSLSAKEKEKKYDFIYTGEITNRNIKRLINSFTTGSMREHSLLVVSRDYEPLAGRLREFRNIQFTGPVQHQEVKQLLWQARFGINYMPDKAPFNQQTSTKLLEYAIAEVPIITNDYNWVREFQKKYGGNFFFLEKDLSNFNWESVSSFNYSFPDLSNWTWEHQIKQSGVVKFLETKFPQLKLIAF